MQNLITTPADYWIAPNAVNIALNALGNANRIQCSVASGAVIMCFIDEIRAETDGGEPGNGDGLWYGANHEPRRWPLSISPTYFNSDTRKYVYAAIPRTTQVGTQALIVFPSELLDIYGRQAAVSDVSPSESSSSSSDDTPAQIGSTDYFYVFLGGIISAVETINSTEQRRWETPITDWGTLETPQGRDESFNKYTFWGQSVNANNQVTGPLAGSIDYIEFANGVRLGVDTADNTLKVYMQNNQQAHLFSTGAVSAFGPSALGGGGGDLILGPLLSALNAEPMPTDDGYLHWTGSAFEWVEPGGGGEMPSTVAWNNITGKPSTFQPSAHTHLKEDITDFAHNHDDRYYTESEMNGFLAAKLAKPSQGSYTKLTVASGGGVTWGTLSASDIPSLTKSKISDFPTQWAWSAISGAPFTGDVANSAAKLSDTAAYTAWGQTFFTGGKPASVSGDLDNVANITMSGHISINSFIVEKTNDGLKHNGNILATGAVSALGISAQGSNSGALSLLSDVYISGTPNDGYVLAYNAALGKWVPQADNGPAAGYETLTVKGGTTTVGTYSPAQALSLSILGGTGIGIVANAANKTITISNTYMHPSDGANETIAQADGRVLSSITVNVYGHVTAVGSKTLAAADIPSLTKSKISDFPTTWAWSAITGTPTTLGDYGITDAATAAQMTAATGRLSTLEGYFDGGVANSAKRLSGTASYTAWGQTYWQNGVPKGSFDGNLTIGTDKHISFKDSNGVARQALDYEGDELWLGWGTAKEVNSVTNVIGYGVNIIVPTENNFENVISVTTDRKVGIGTDTPSQELHVVGNIMATGAVSALGISAQGSNSGALSLLTDVNISGTPTDGYVLTYDSTSGKWTPQATQATDLSVYATRQWVEQNWLVKNALASQPAAPPAVNPGDPARSYKLVVTDVSLSSGTLQFTKDYIKDTFAKADIVDFAHTHSTQDIDGLSNYALSSEVSQLRSDIGSFVGSLSFSGDYMEVGTKDAREGYMGTVSALLVPFATTTMGFKRLSVTGSQIADANTMTVGGVEYALLANYASIDLWANMPSGMSWGNVLQLTSSSSLSGQLAWDSNHNVTTGVTRKLYWRSRNSNGWGTNGWHTIAFEDWVATQLNTLGDNLQSYVTTQLAGYLPLTAGSSKPLTGNISFKGTKATKEMIAFIDNKSDQRGNGIAIGGGGATIIGGGKSASVIASQLTSGGNEVMFIGNDKGVKIYTNLQDGWSYRKEFAFDSAGGLTIPGSLAVGNGAGLYIIDTSGTAQMAVFLNSYNQFFVGFGMRNAGYTGYFDSYIMHLRSGASGTTMTLDASNNVGIGTASPSCKLDVNGIAKANYVLFKNYNDNSNAGYCGRGNSSSNDIFLMSYAANVHIGANSSSNDIYINTSHNVGIGTISPSCKLDVNGAAHISGDNSNYGIILANNKALGFTDSSGTNVRAFYLNYQDYLSLGWNTALKGYNTGIYGKTLVFGTGTSTNEAARITAAGNVGIGTDNPQHKLHVAGNVVATGAVSALGVSSQGTAVGAVAADTLQVLGTSTLNGATTVNNTLDVSGDVTAENDVTVGGNLNLGEEGYIYAVGDELFWYAFSTGMTKKIAFV